MSRIKRTQQFRETVELFRNTAIWEKKNGDWVLKNKLV